MHLVLGSEDLAYPLRILSDLHFRDSHSPLRHRDQLRALFMGAGTVILNGDTVEEIGQSPVESRRDLDEVLSAGREAGAVLILLSGNHDPSFSRIRKLTLTAHGLAIHHGDGLREGGLSSRPRGRRLSWAAMRILWKLWGGFHRRHLRGLRGNVVVGHSHRPGIWRTSDGTLFNLGAHGPLTWARALEIDSPNATQWRWRTITYSKGIPCFSDEKALLVETISSHGTDHTLGLSPQAGLAHAAAGAGSDA